MKPVPRQLARTTSATTTGTELVLVPVGSIEQHGPHLPLDTDTVIAEAVAYCVAARHADAWVAPPLSYGSSGEHQPFPGTTSIGTPTLQLVLIELVRSMRTWAQRVVFVNAHGGNVFALRAAVSQMRHEGHDVDWVACTAEPPTIDEADLHAGYAETSLMLHLRPQTVHMDLAAPGNTAPLPEILPRLMDGGVAAVSPNGVLGDPTGASPEEGAEVLEALVASVLKQMAPITTTAPGTDPATATDPVSV